MWWEPLAAAVVCAIADVLFAHPRHWSDPVIAAVTGAFVGLVVKYISTCDT